MFSSWQVAIAIAAILSIHIVWGYAAALQRAAALRKANPGLPIVTLFFNLESPIRTLDLIPRWIPFRIGSINVFMHHLRTSKLKELGSDMIALVDSKTVDVFVANPVLVHDVIVNRQKELGKNVNHYEMLNIFGKNVLGTEGEVWRRHRRVVAPSFSEKNNALVHESSVRIAKEMIGAWEEQSTSDDDFTVNVSANMMQYALSVISSAGFGKDLSWGEEGSELLGNHKMTFKTALETVVSNFILYLVLPSFCFNLPFQTLRKARIARKEFGDYLDEIINEAASSLADSSHNLLQALVMASLMDNEKSGSLSKDELKGNAFIFIVAGHETTASSLSYTLALLASHPEIQEKLHDECVRALEGRKEPEYSDFGKLTYALAVMNESLRLHSIVSGMPKWTGDNSVTVGNFVLPPQSVVHVLLQTTQRDPNLWGDDVNEFKPERFLGRDQPLSIKMGWAPFSEGARGCVGKKFAQVETVALLTLITLKYKVRLPDGVSVEQVLETNPLFLGKPDRPVNLVFSHR
ncbi:cytochrome P450 [Rhizoclosmatium globosum]|uniref:Cytochrome P450 n=1 Tax=Rhizoclosmatium globosum TaxID=329046 RepID=A0A1Y2CZW3_9FUNG|nr:cytochrome P450 [Rhizoclosmatium globosum]|eukprot:ORY52416.1 cytochrome P450 [Rhizoclosmatium globosum]